MVKTRFAPSPTGYLHVGGLRTALYNYLFARQNHGRIVLRIEDTDQNRKVADAVPNLLRTFKQIGLAFDEGPEQGGDSGPYYQSQRLDIYRKTIGQLMDAGHAYPCFCSAERLAEMRQTAEKNNLSTRYDRHCLSLPREEALARMAEESHVIRLRIPDGDMVEFQDEVRGKVSFNTAEIDDQVLMKSDGFPTYHMANVVDDHLMGITHVIRGEEWLPSTPKHILLYQLLEWEPPVFAHLPLLLNPDKSKLSKRQGDVAAEDFMKKGYLPEALLNFVALLGWNPGTDEEFFTLDQLANAFSLDRIQKGGAVFDTEKLNWMNSHYIRELDLSDISRRARIQFEKDGLNVPEDEKYLKVIGDARRRITTMNEITSYSKMYFTRPEPKGADREILLSDNTRSLFRFWIETLDDQEDWSADDLKSLLKKSQKELGIKGRDLYFPLRLALYGSCHGPDIPTLFDILGSKEAIGRFKHSLELE